MKKKLRDAISTDDLDTVKKIELYTNLMNPSFLKLAKKENSVKVINYLESKPTEYDVLEWFGFPRGIDTDLKDKYIGYLKYHLQYLHENDDTEDEKFYSQFDNYMRIDSDKRDPDEKINDNFSSKISRKFAYDNNIDEDDVVGTGKGGDITKRDLLKYIKKEKRIIR